MNTSILRVLQQDEICYRLQCNKYSALFCPGFGANILELIDKFNNISVLRFNSYTSMENIKSNILLYGIPILFLPNRFHNGILKTSQTTFHFPINEPRYNNYIHGFLHQREFTVTETLCVKDYCSITAEYNYDKNDPFYTYFPLDFTAEITYNLSDKGLEQIFKITNYSNLNLPVLVACHTAINLPFDNKSDIDDLRIKMDVDKRLVIDENLCCTGNFKKLSCYDSEYQSGSVNPLTQVIDNEMFILSKDAKYNGVDIYNSNTYHGIRYIADEKYKYWLLWNNNSNNELCCVEPMTSMIDASQIALSNDITGYTEIRYNETWSAKQFIFSY